MAVKGKYKNPKVKLSKNEKVCYTSYDTSGEIIYCIVGKMIIDSKSVTGLRSEYTRWDNVNGVMVKGDKKSLDPTELY